MQKIYLASDHGGFELKSEVKTLVESLGFEVTDLGCNSEDSCDYPAFGKTVGEAVVGDAGSLGIVICGSGIGISIAANKVPEVRCALCCSTELASLARQHNGANVLALGARTTGIDSIEDIVKTFLTTEVDPSDRHERRRGQLDVIS